MKTMRAKLRKLTLVLLLAVAPLSFAAPVRAAEPNIVPLGYGGYIDLTTGVTGGSIEEVKSKVAAGVGSAGGTVGGAPSAGAAAASTAGVETGTGPAPDDASSAFVVGTSAPPAALFFPLREAVTRGRAMLAEKIKEEAAKRKKARTVASTNSPVNVTLAVWHSQSNSVELVDLVKTGLKVNLDEDTDLDISVKRSNGVNSEFVLAGADDSYVVAAQMPIYKEKWVSKKKIYEITDVVYTPYAAKLHVPEVVAWGQSTLDQYVNEVYADLRATGVKSRAFPGKLMADVINPDLAKAIVLIEHLSSQSLLGADSIGAAESVLVIMALNQEDSYAYSRSSAGAKGLVQFIPSTYKLIAKRADLNLDQNFERGMSDPHNAIKAEVAYLDAELASMPLAVKDLLSVNPAQVHEYLAAAYNGGGGRVRKAISAWGEAWSDDHTADIASLTAQNKALLAQIKSLKAKVAKAPTAKAARPLKDELYLTSKKQAALAAQITAGKAGALRPETVGYVKKLRAVRQYLGGDSPRITLASAP